MSPVLISSFLLVFCFSANVEADIHTVLRELDSADLEQRGLASQYDRQMLNEYRKTLIKEEILSRLGLSSPPNISAGSSFLPTNVIEHVLLQGTQKEEQATEDTEAYYGVTKQVVVMAEPVQPSDSATSKSQILRFHSNLPKSSIASLMLGFERDPRVLSRRMLKKDGILSFRVLQHRSNGRKRPVHVIKTDGNWVILNITNLTSGRDGNQMNISVEVVCEHCNGKKFMWNSKNSRPFLVLDVKPPRKRVARSSRCSGSRKKCCLVQYKVDFYDLGWQDWIIFPHSMFLNYCAGSCNSRGVYNQRNIIMQRLVARKTSKPASFAGLGKTYREPCCVVTKMSSVSLIFKTGEGLRDIVKEDVPNMRATGCGCSV